MPASKIHKLFKRYIPIFKMWFIFTLKKEFKKISNSFNKIKIQLTELNSEVKKNNENISELVSKKEIDLMIREHLLKVQSIPKSEHNSNATPDKTNFERVILRKAKKTRPEVLKQRIKGYLEDNMRTGEIYKILVEEQHLIGKTQFYHYLNLVRAELQIKPLTEITN